MLPPILAGPALDRALDRVLGHVVGQGLVDRQAQARVAAEIRAAHLGRDRDLADEFGKQLAALGILAFLAVLNIGPFTVSGHGLSPGLYAVFGAPCCAPF